ncbi:uncharacterized protein P884DRAFT_268178 [Thermothelomyces heterothallicus CBS 202.75]|uniref:uncharacterized protein n=1 Tax=Thermothelomyces heterothallicus CBS 202.75 TaxID=1149848 RepID=UPI0037437AD9
MHRLSPVVAQDIAEVSRALSSFKEEVTELRKDLQDKREKQKSVDDITYDGSMQSRFTSLVAIITSCGLLVRRKLQDLQRKRSLNELKVMWSDTIEAGRLSDPRFFEIGLLKTIDRTMESIAQKCETAGYKFLANSWKYDGMELECVAQLTEDLWNKVNGETHNEDAIKDTGEKRMEKTPGEDDEDLELNR